MTLQELEVELTEGFRARGVDQPGLEARFILREAGLPANPDVHQVAKARHWLKERLDGVPLAYLCGKKGFYKSEFFVEKGVLVPRPETEHVIETALKRQKGARRIADLGCGSGCIGLSLLLEMPTARLWAVDRSAKACEVTMRNARFFKLEDRVEVKHGPVQSWTPGVQFNLIVANPPYIAEGDPRVQMSVVKHEPAEALFSGPDGLAAIRSWSSIAKRNLTDGGLFVCEIGTGQREAVHDILDKAGFRDIELQKDLAGHDRVMSAVKAE